MHRRSWLLLSLGSVVAFAALLPVIYLLIRLSSAGSEAWSLFANPRIWEVFGNSLLLTAISTAASIALGVPLAWLTTRTDLPFRRFWTVATILPLAMPSYVMAYAFIALLGPAGLFSDVTRTLFGKTLPGLYGLWGTALVMTLINYPFVTLSARAALQRLDPALEEAALGLGTTRRQIFWRVIMPQLRPAVTAGGLLVALYVLSDFGTPALMQFRAFTLVIHMQYQSAFDRSAAAATALLLVALTMAILAAESFTRGRARYHRMTPATQRPASLVALGKWKPAAIALCGSVFGVSVVLPIATMCWWMFVAVRNGQSLAIPVSAIRNSVVAGSLAAALAVIAAVPVAYLSVRHRGALVRVIDRAAYAGNALPGIVVALAMVFFGARLYQIENPAFSWLGALYQSLPMLVFAYVVRFLPQSVGAMRASLLQVNPRLEEAARSLGRSRWGVFFAVTLPLLMPGVLTGAALVFLTTLKELPITIMLSPMNFPTLVQKVWSNASEGLFAQASPPALLLVGLSAISIIFILRQERAQESGGRNV